MKPSSPKWFSRECEVAIAEKNKLFQSFKRFPSAGTHTAYRSARNACKSVIEKAKASHIDRISAKLLACPSGSRSFWALSKAICSNFCGSSFPPMQHTSGHPVTSSIEKANLFARSFAANSTLDPSNQTPPQPAAFDVQMPGFNVCERKVLRVLRKLNTAKSTGPDDVPAVVLKKCAPELAPVLTRLYQISLSVGKCPSSWKVAHVVPIPKKGDRSDPCNYRPIAITSVMSKVFETLLSDAMFL